MIPHIHFIFVTQCLVLVAFSQRIQLFPYNETKNCNLNLVEEMDSIVMYGKVDFNGNIPASSVVNFEIRRTTETNFYSLSFLNVPEDCDKDLYYCKCLKTDDHKVFLFSLNITAHKNNSEADIRTELVYRDITFYSEIRKLPIVHDSQTEVVGVYADDQVVNFQQSDVLINDTKVTIVSSCREKFAQHCKLQLTDLETGALLKYRKAIVVYNTNIKGRANLNLKYSVCNIERNISFLITSNATTTSLNLTTETNLVVIILLTVNILIAAMMFSCNKKFRIKIQRLNCKRCINDDTTKEELQSMTNECTTDWNSEANEKSQEKNTKNVIRVCRNLDSLEDKEYKVDFKIYRENSTIYFESYFPATKKTVTISTFETEENCTSIDQKSNYTMSSMKNSESFLVSIKEGSIGNDFKYRVRIGDISAIETICEKYVSTNFRPISTVSTILPAFTMTLNEKDINEMCYKVIEEKLLTFEAVCPLKTQKDQWYLKIRDKEQVLAKGFNDLHYEQEKIHKTTFQLKLDITKITSIFISPLTIGQFEKSEDPMYTFFVNVCGIVLFYLPKSICNVIKTIWNPRKIKNDSTKKETLEMNHEE